MTDNTAMPSQHYLGKFRSRVDIMFRSIRQVSSWKYFVWWSCASRYEALDIVSALKTKCRRHVGVECFFFSDFSLIPFPSLTEFYRRYLRTGFIFLFSPNTLAFFHGILSAIPRDRMLFLFWFSPNTPCFSRKVFSAFSCLMGAVYSMRKEILALNTLPRSCISVPVLSFYYFCLENIAPYGLTIARAVSGSQKLITSISEYIEPRNRNAGVLRKV